MLRPLSPIVNKLSGPFNKHSVFRTMRDGSLVIAKRASHMGPERDLPSIKYMQECWRILDAAWHTLTDWERIEWAKCSPRVHGGRVTGFIHYKTVNLNRFLVDLPALRRPPDKFRNHRREFTLKHGKIVRAWAGGQTKNPKGMFDGPYVPLPPPGNPCLPPYIPFCPEFCENCPRTYWASSPWRPRPDPPDFPWLPIPQDEAVQPPWFQHECIWLAGPEIWWWNDTWEYKADFTYMDCDQTQPIADSWRAQIYIRILHVPSMQFAYAVFYYRAPVGRADPKCPTDPSHYSGESYYWGNFTMNHLSQIRMTDYDPNA